MRRFIFLLIIIFATRAFGDQDYVGIWPKDSDRTYYETYGYGIIDEKNKLVSFKDCELKSYDDLDNYEFARYRYNKCPIKNPILIAPDTFVRGIKIPGAKIQNQCQVTKGTTETLILTSDSKFNALRENNPYMARKWEEKLNLKDHKDRNKEINTEWHFDMKSEEIRIYQLPNNTKPFQTLHMDETTKKRIMEYRKSMPKIIENNIVKRIENEGNKRKPILPYKPDNLFSIRC